MEDAEGQKSPNITIFRTAQFFVVVKFRNIKYTVFKQQDLWLRWGKIESGD